MKYPPQLIAAVQAASDIVEVVRERVDLKKKGTNYWGRCPFHSEKTASFSVSPSKGIFKCFGCGKGGSVFQFIMETDGLSFGEAVRVLAERARIELPKPGREDEERFNREDSLFETNRWAMSAWIANLQSPAGKAAREYLENRGITAESISKFNLGYALPGWEDLKSTAYRDQIRSEFLEELGLVIRGDQGKTYDRFRDRLMFPIQDHIGRYIGFGGRIMTSDTDFAKYMNSPESAVYHKSRVLYGLFQARESIRKKESVLIVEGYLDVISLHQAGFTHAVATSGTALTPDQVRLIKRYTDKNVVFLYDGDSAGLSAMERSLPVLFTEGIIPTILTLPDNHDPDSFIRQKGADQFTWFLNEKRRSAIDFVLGYYQSQAGDAINDREEAIRRVIDLAAVYPDGVGRDLIIQELASLARIPESTLFASLKKRGGQQSLPTRPVREKPMAPPDTLPAVKPVRTTLLAPERDLLKLIIEYGKVVAAYLGYFVAPGYFPTELARSVYEKALALSEEREYWELQDLADRCTEHEQELVYRLAIEKYSISPRWKSMGFDKESLDVRRWIEDAITRLRIQSVESHIHDLKNQLASTDDPEVQQSMMRSVQELLAEKKKLLSGDLFRQEDEPA
ncbi:MAG: DNA primase [Bacteroidetes bacterium]|nr:DNA primase [Bacteroidota bacterium]